MNQIQSPPALQERAAYHAAKHRTRPAQALRINEARLCIPGLGLPFSHAARVLMRGLGEGVATVVGACQHQQVHSGNGLT